MNKIPVNLRIPEDKKDQFQRKADEMGLTFTDLLIKGAEMLIESENYLGAQLLKIEKLITDTEVVLENIDEYEPENFGKTEADALKRLRAAHQILIRAQALQDDPRSYATDEDGNVVYRFPYLEYDTVKAFDQDDSIK